MEQINSVNHSRVPRKEILQFSTGIAGQNMTYVLIASWMFYYCTDVLYITPMAVGLIIGISRIWDAFNDPIMGVVMDRTRFKNGEKLRPYLLYTPLFIGILSFIMFVNPGFKSEAVKIAYIFIIYILWDILYTFQDIAQWGMTAIMSPISSERAKIVQWARIGAQVGSLLPGLVPIIISNKDKLGLSEPQVFAIFGLLLGLGGMSLSLLTHKAQERVRSEKPTEPLLKSINLLFKNKIVMIILIASILQSMSLTVPAIYFFKYKVALTIFGRQLDGMTFMIVFGIIVGLPGVLTMLVATKFSKLVKGMKNILILACVMNIAARFTAFFIGFEGISIVFVMILLALSSIPNGMIGIATTTLWGDSLDYMEYKTGKRAEAITFATQNLISKATNGIAAIMAGITLTLLKFDASLFEAGLPQGEVFNKWIWAVFILGPMVGSILYLLPLLFINYPESLKREIEQKLIERRTEAGLEID